MLIRFAVANHRSISAAVELSMVAVDEDRATVRRPERLSEPLLTLAAIYGPNASGKSNVLSALSWLSVAVSSSLAMWDDGVPREPFRFGGGGQQPTMFEVDFLHEGIRHIYTLHVDDESVLFEELVSYPERRPRQLFVRDGEDVHFRRGTPSAAAMRELAGPTTALLLSVARRLDVEDLAGPAHYLAGISAPFQLPRPRLGGAARPTSAGARQSTRQLFIEDYRAGKGQGSLVRTTHPADAAVARALLRHADLGILDVLVKEEVDSRQVSRFELRLLHGAAHETVEFDLSEESDGTQMWFKLIGPVLAALRHGRPLILDEIDASLHPKLSAELLELFRSPETNPNNSQLIFTTHDTTLLNELNRDEVWLTEKREDGATALTSLAEYGGERVRRSVNLERAYLQGRFGAVPNLGALTVDRLLGVERPDAWAAHHFHSAPIENESVREAEH